MSTSLWGRELKGVHYPENNLSQRVDLLVRSWIERFPPVGVVGSMARRPPCEVVNWKFALPGTGKPQAGRPPCEVVNWKIWEGKILGNYPGRPPCEVVNWKTVKQCMSWPISGRPPCEVVNWKVRAGPDNLRNFVDLLVRSWIERALTYVCQSPYLVDLLVRSWIERYDFPLFRYPVAVDLLVRSWIERQKDALKRRWPIQSTSLWGRELKVVEDIPVYHGLRSTSLWGRELKG